MKPVSECHKGGQLVLAQQLPCSPTRGAICVPLKQYPCRVLGTQGFPEKDMTKLEDYGFVASRPRGEYHANNQQMAKLLHKAIGLGGKKAAPMVLHASPSPHLLDSPAPVDSFTCSMSIHSYMSSFLLPAQGYSTH